MIPYSFQQFTAACPAMVVDYLAAYVPEWHRTMRRGGPMPLPSTVITAFLNYLRSYLEAPCETGSPLGFSRHVGKLPELSNNEFTTEWFGKPAVT
jgi:hypothetical protein